MTLMEVLICLTIMGVLICLTAPIAPSFYAKNQRQVIIDEIKTAIRFAKIQTIVRGERLILLPRNHERDWSSGMALYVEKGRKIQIPSIYEWIWPTALRHIEWRGFQSKQYMRFAPNLSQSAINGSFIIKVKNEDPICLVVSRFGAIRMQTAC